MKIESRTPRIYPAIHERLLIKFIRKLTILLTLKQALIFMSIWCFTWGSLGLVLRAVIGVPRRPLLWGIAGLLVAVVAAVIVARKQLPSRASVLALLDERHGCGGLLMASGDVPIGDWQERIPGIRLPRLKWRSPKIWGLFAGSVVFVVAGLAVPARYASVDSRRTLDVSREVNELGEKIDILKEESVIDQIKAEALEQKLDQLAAEASGEDPVKTWEALDHLTDAIDGAAKAAAESAAVSEEKLARAEALTEGLMAGLDKMDSKLMTEAMQALSGMVKEAVEQNQMLAKNLSPEIRESLKSGALKPEQLKGLSEALKQNKSALSQKLSKLNRAGMIDAKSLKAEAQADARGNAGLSRFLEEHASRMSVEDAVEAWSSGKGGVSRGRGDAAMTWSDGTNEKNAKFKEKELPPSAVSGLKDSQLVGLSADAPTIENSTAVHGTLNRAATGGGSAYTQTILPRHKGAVKRYFERQ